MKTGLVRLTALFAGCLLTTGGCSSLLHQNNQKVSIKRIRHIKLTPQDVIGAFDPVRLLEKRASDPETLAGVETYARINGPADHIWYYWAGAMRLSEALNDPSKKAESGAKGERWLKTGCQAGSGMSCQLLAEEQRSGRILPRDERAADALMDATCQKGFLPSCAHLGLRALKAVQKEGADAAVLARAVGYLKTAVYGGGDNAWKYYLEGRQLQMKAEGKEFTPERLTEGCRTGDGEACVMALIGPGDQMKVKDRRDADLQTAEKGCLVTNSLGCRIAGEYIINRRKDLNVHADYALTISSMNAGIDYLDRACIAGDHAACRFMSNIRVDSGYYFSPEQKARMATGSDGACNAGIAGACLMQIALNDVKRDERPDSSPSYVAKACALNHPAACAAYLSDVLPMQAAAATPAQPLQHDAAKK